MFAYELPLENDETCQLCPLFPVALSSPKSTTGTKRPVFQFFRR